MSAKRGRYGGRTREQRDLDEEFGVTEPSVTRSVGVCPRCGWRQLPGWVACPSCTPWGDRLLMRERKWAREREEREAKIVSGKWLGPVEERSQPNLVVGGLRFTPTLRPESRPYFHGSTADPHGACSYTEPLTISEYSTEGVWTESIEALYGDGLRRFAKGEKP